MMGAPQAVPAAILAVAHAGSRGVEAAGFRLVSEVLHRSFDYDLVGQNGTLDLG